MDIFSSHLLNKCEQLTEEYHKKNHFVADGDLGRSGGVNATNYLLLHFLLVRKAWRVARKRHLIGCGG
jgi:hypothetical protein